MRLIPGVCCGPQAQSATRGRNLPPNVALLTVDAQAQPGHAYRKSCDMRWRWARHVNVTRLVRGHAPLVQSRAATFPICRMRCSTCSRCARVFRLEHRSSSASFPLVFTFTAPRYLRYRALPPSLGCEPICISLPPPTNLHNSDEQGRVYRDGFVDHQPRWAHLLSLRLGPHAIIISRVSRAIVSFNIWRHQAHTHTTQDHTHARTRKYVRTHSAR